MTPRRLLSLVATGMILAGCGRASTSSGTPNPTPTPVTPDFCIIYFETAYTATVSDIYEVLMPVAKWANGSVPLTFGTGGNPVVDAVYTKFRYKVDFSAASAPHPSLATGVATNGSFALSAIGGDQPGSAFTFAGSGTTLTFYDLASASETGVAPTGVQTGTGGSGAGSGFLSDPVIFKPGGLGTAAPFAGSVNVHVVTATVNSSLTIGSSTSNVAGCVDSHAFAPNGSFDQLADSWATYAHGAIHR